MPTKPLPANGQTPCVKFEAVPAIFSLRFSPLHLQLTYKFSLLFDVTIIKQLCPAVKFFFRNRSKLPAAVHTRTLHSLQSP